MFLDEKKNHTKITPSLYSTFYPFCLFLCMLVCLFVCSFVRSFVCFFCIWYFRQQCLNIPIYRHREEKCLYKQKIKEIIINIINIIIIIIVVVVVVIIIIIIFFKKKMQKSVKLSAGSNSVYWMVKHFYSCAMSSWSSSFSRECNIIAGTANAHTCEAKKVVSVEVPRCGNPLTWFSFLVRNLEITAIHYHVNNVLILYN